MLPKPESACFVIADISGYTGFLRGDAYRDSAGEAEAEGPGVSRSCRRGIPEEHYRTVEIEKLRQLLQGQDGAPAAVEEPMLPVPAERFLTEPVHAR